MDNLQEAYLNVYSSEGYEPITPERQAKIDRKRESVKKKEDIATYQRRDADADKQYKRGVALTFRQKMSQVGTHEEVSYNDLLKFLYFEGYADSYAEAEELLESISDEEFEEILEAHSFPLKPSERAIVDRIARRNRGEDVPIPSSTKSAKKVEPKAKTEPEAEEPQPRKKRKLEFEVREEFDVVAEYLFVEGFADSIENAEVMAENISEEWANKIMEARRSEREGMGSPETRYSKTGQPLSGQRARNRARGAIGGRHFYSGGEGGSKIERGKKKNEPQSQQQRLNPPEEKGRQLQRGSKAAMQRGHSARD
jgi:hypothetical protein